MMSHYVLGQESFIVSSVVSFSPVTQRRTAWYCANRKREFFFFNVRILFVYGAKYSRECYYQVPEIFLGPDLQLMWAKYCFQFHLEGRKESPIVPFETMQSL